MRVQAIMRSGKALEFFVEGARSRSREFLPPKRGLLRCLQASGIPTALVPIAISYDRMPEEAAFAHELSGGAKPPMRLSGLLGWAWRAFRGGVSLGRIHIAAGAVVHLDEHSSVPAVAEAVVEELRAAMAVTEFHLEAYLAHHPIDGHDAASLKQLIESGGRRVLSSKLRPDETLSPHIARTMAEHFTGHLPPALTQQRPLVLVADSDQLLEVGG